MNSLRFKIILSYIFLSTSLFANNILHQADSLYLARDYFAAKYQYEQVLETDRFLKHDYVLNFKLGICYYADGDYNSALAVFEQLPDDPQQLKAYRDYYIFLTSLDIKPVSDINHLATRYLQEYKNHYLADSLRIHFADYQYAIANYHVAATHYARLERKRKFKKQKAYLKKQIAFCKYNLGQEDAGIKKMYQVIKKHKNSPEALQIVKFMEQDEDVVQKYFFTIADVYIAHDYFALLRTKLEKYAREIDDPVLKEKARYYILRVYYNKGEYQTALFGLNNMLDNLQSKLLKPRIELMIARSHLRLNNLEQAAIAYIKYAENNPRRRLADDAMWKAAWIYEEQGSIKNALAIYKKIMSHWPASSYSKESHFRLGLCYYRLGWFATAEQLFQELMQRKNSTFHEHRAKYWLAKTYRESGKTHEAEKLFIELGSNVFESYYATKSYMHFADQVNSIYHIDLFLQNEDNPLSIYMDSQIDLIDRFNFLFLIDEIFGHEFVFKELAQKKYFPSDLAGWVNLAEIYKRLGAYNRAYRVYDHIDRAYFSDLLTYEKPFILKEAYPLYFDELINIYAHNRHVDHNLVLAVIRAESAYDQNAHSWANAYGLMQIIPRTASQVAKELKLQIDIPQNLFDPETNINLGTFYLKNLLRRFDNRITYALAAYNAGPHRVDKWQKINHIGEEDLFVENIEFSQTRNYVRKVLRNYWIYQILDSGY